MATAGAVWLPAVPAPSKIVATHLSYRSRMDEYAMAHPLEAPAFFLKPPSSVSAHRAPVARPRGCRFLNYEGELAVVIGERCLGTSVADALRYVRGYTVANDWGVHDFRHADRGAMLRVKGQDGFCPLGPVLVDAEDVDPDDLWLRTYVDGELVQEAHTGTDLVFSAAYQVADAARLMTLEPGDVLLTGTPAHSRPVAAGTGRRRGDRGHRPPEQPGVELDRDLEPVGEQPRVTAATLHVALAMPEDEAEREAAAVAREPGRRRPRRVASAAAVAAHEDIHPQDVVRVARRGRVFHALVRGRVPGGFQVQPLEPGLRATTVKAADVTFHWRAAGVPGPAADPAQPSLDHLLDR